MKVSRKKQHYNFKVNFTPEEIKEKGSLLSVKIEDKNKVEVEKKEVNKKYKRAIDSIDQDIDKLACHIRDGYEFKEDLCNVIFDAKNGIKEYYFEGVFVGKEPMNTSDYQLEIEEDEEDEDKGLISAVESFKELSESTGAEIKVTATDHKGKEEVIFDNSTAKTALEFDESSDNKAKKTPPKPKDKPKPKAKPNGKK